MQHIYWPIADSIGGRCGPAAAPWDLVSWRQAGIRAIVSLDDTQVFPSQIEAAGIAHLPIYWPMIELTSRSLQRDFVQRLPIIFRFLQQHTRDGGKAVVHCYHGLDRTGAVLACYLVYRYGCSAREAIEAIRKLRPQALSAYGYAQAVQLFAEQRCELSSRQSLDIDPS
ncbi:MAG: dual specificity protein phosphatase family protein [Gemmatales bacterium]|nr:dual specificity protein phosphatase family protein [Gemmatales bacterium]MDW8174164.1 dual specificity protein phosphatase family protein [Gemmatales bacterium]